MAIDQNRKRYRELRAWLEDHDITFPAIAERIGMSTSGARAICRAKTCRTQHHVALLALGFPCELLPKPLDRPVGRPPKIPRFPGLESGHPQT